MRVWKKLTAWETQWSFWTRSAQASVQPGGQTSTADTAEHMSHVLSSKSRFQQMSIWKLYFLLESSGLLPSDTIFTSGNNVLKGRPKSSTQRADNTTLETDGTEQTLFYPIALTIWYLKISYFISNRNICTVFQPNRLKTNILDLMSQLSGSKESDEQCSPDLVQQLPITLKVKFEQTKQTMLIHDTIFLNIFPKIILGKKSIWFL